MTQKEYLYRVSFERHIDCRIDSLVFYCWATNAKEAKDTARTAWTARSSCKRRIPFMFHLDAHRSDVQDVDALSITDWMSREIRGQYLLRSFRMIDTRTWRVNGRNLYGR